MDVTKKIDESNSSFPMGETAQEKHLPYVPECYKVEPSERAGNEAKGFEFPIIDLGGMNENDPVRRSVLVEEIGNACRRNGFFHVVNHGISQGILDGALSVASEFFDLPTKEKSPFMSKDVHKPVRYGTSLKDGVDRVQYWRAFLKHYAHPLQDWVGMWPQNPPCYREKMGEYAVEAQKLAQSITGLITESLGLGKTYLTKKLDQGMQVTTVNSYRPCPEPWLALGLPPHSDYGCLTVLLQDSPGLQIFDPHDGVWRIIPLIKGALQVHVGDQMEVLSNGRYKSVLHRVTLNNTNTRISIAGLHSLEMDTTMKAADEMVDEEHPNGYRENSFRDFLDFIAKNDIAQGRRFLDTLKLKE